MTFFCLSLVINYITRWVADSIPKKFKLKVFLWFFNSWQHLYISFIVYVSRIAICLHFQKKQLRYYSCCLDSVASSAFGYRIWVFVNFVVPGFELQHADSRFRFEFYVLRRLPGSLFSYNLYVLGGSLGNVDRSQFEKRWVRCSSVKTLVNVRNYCIFE